jgi:hypothetical protein
MATKRAAKRIVKRVSKKVVAAPTPAKRAVRENFKLVRLKPYDKRRRHVMKVYVHGPTGKKFEERKGWYKVDVELARYLGGVQEIEGDEYAPLAFDICTQEEAKRIDDTERRVRERRAQSDEANDLTTSDLRGSRRHSMEPNEAHGDRGATRRGAQPATRPRSMQVADLTD